MADCICQGGVRKIGITNEWQGWVELCPQHAAAPDLLAALEALLAIADQAGVWHVPCDQARQAIAKAKGQA